MMSIKIIENSKEQNQFYFILSWIASYMIMIRNDSSGFKRH